MISIKKTTALWIIIVVLVLINLVTVGSFWLTHPRTMIKNRWLAPLASSDNERQQRPSRVGHFLEQRLGFSEEQSEAYRQLRQEYFNKARLIYDEISKLKESLYQGISQENAQDTNEIAKRIGELHAEAELLTYEHFRQIRELGTEEQKIQLDSVLTKIMDRSIRPFPRNEGMRERRSR